MYFAILNTIFAKMHFNCHEKVKFANSCNPTTLQSTPPPEETASAGGLGLRKSNNQI